MRIFLLLDQADQLERRVGDEKAAILVGHIDTTSAIPAHAPATLSALRDHAMMLALPAERQSCCGLAR